MEIRIPDNFFTETERERLMEILELDEPEWSSALQRLAMAALSEFRQMLLGDGVPTRADEILQHRLHHLIIFYFEDRIPSEAQVSAMFQLTETRSKSLIRNTLTRFRHQLRSQQVRTLRQVLDSATEEESGDYVVVILSDTIVEDLNFIISQKAPRLDPVRKRRNTARTYEITADSFDVLSEHLHEASAHLEVAAATNGVE